jgi:hypothetical protein
MKEIGKLFGMKDNSEAERAAKAQAEAAHAEAEEAKKRRAESDQQAAIAGQQGSGSIFLANRGTRYSGLKPSLGG